jgi:hypothetical protein
VRARDGAGNVDPTPASRTWTVETAPPDTPPDTSPPDTAIVLGTSGTVASSAASFSFSSTEFGSTFECRLDASEWAACSSPHAYAGLADGPHSFEVRATDAARNTDPDPASQSWTIDTTAPDTTIVSGPPAETTSPSATFSFISSESGSTFECRLDNGAWSSCISPKSYSGIGPGNHTFQVHARDSLGNADPTPASHTWKRKR